MKLALVTDLHANREAVEAVLEHAAGQGAQRYAFLGDFVGYGADPAWVVDTVRAHVERGAVAVYGNHDLGVVAGVSPTMMPIARAAVEWTRRQLSDEQVAFLRELPLLRTEEDLLCRGRAQPARHAGPLHLLRTHAPAHALPPLGGGQGR
jgi:predicted phosphodiesterase